MRAIRGPHPSGGIAVQIGNPADLPPGGRRENRFPILDSLMTNPADVITLKGLRKVFQTDEVETHALSDVHLSVARGEYVSISGPSGCGKTTLLSILGLLDTASAGSYVLNGHDVAALGAAERARIRNAEIGFIFQAFNLIGDLSVQENVELPLTYRAGIGASERRERVQEALERVGMSHRMRHYPAQLSGGQQQRVAVARALVGRPAILLADEPTGNLDPDLTLEVMSLLTGLSARGTTVVIATHDRAILERHPRRVVRLEAGRIAEDRRAGEAGGASSLEFAPITGVAANAPASSSDGATAPSADGMGGEEVA